MIKMYMHYYYYYSVTHKNLVSVGHMFLKLKRYSRYCHVNWNKQKFHVKFYRDNQYSDDQVFVSALVTESNSQFDVLAGGQTKIFPVSLRQHGCVSISTIGKQEAAT